MTQNISVNGRQVPVDVPPDMPLLWVLRDVIGLTGTKFGCGMALCGVCTIHLDGRAVRACTTPISAVASRSITTIEGIQADKIGKAVQAAWRELSVPQCGYCLSGPDHVGNGLAAVEPESDGRGHRRRNERKHLPLRNLFAH